MVQDIDDDDWLLGPALAPLLAARARNGLVFDALVLPHHLRRLLRVISRHPDLEFVLDHCGKPRLRPATLPHGNATSRCLPNTLPSSANCRDW
jgi:L-fuconolactonase